MSVVYVGVDDTDVKGSPGTGRVARGLAKELESLGLTRSLGVSRHQLLVDDRIRYTSHNSSKGIAVDTQLTVDELLAAATGYMARCFVTGADPGLCFCADRQVNQEIIDYGRLATSAVIPKTMALALAKKSGVVLKELGGTGDGVIGALAAVGLRAAGNDGRLVDLRGIHDIRGVLSVAELLRLTDIDHVESTSGIVLGRAEVIDSQDRIRPSLVGGRPVLRVQRNGADSWVPVESRHKQGHEGGER